MDEQSVTTAGKVKVFWTHDVALPLERRRIKAHHPYFMDAEEAQARLAPAGDLHLWVEGKPEPADETAEEKGEESEHDREVAAVAAENASAPSIEKSQSKARRVLGGAVVATPAESNPEGGQ